MIRKIIIKFLLKLFEEELPLHVSLNNDTRRTMLSRVYQNPAFLEYLDEREQALIKNCFDMFLNNNIEDARMVAGQVHELRTLHNHLRVCYNYKRENRNTSKNSLRGHTQDNQSD